MELLIDMNLSPHWVNYLRDAGFQAEHWSCVGSIYAPDTEIMEYARLHHYVVLTHDLDFGMILAATKGKKPSVVQIRADDVRPHVISHFVIAALKQTESDLKQGALLTINPNSARLRLLPLVLQN